MRKSAAKLIAAILLTLGAASAGAQATPKAGPTVAGESSTSIPAKIGIVAGFTALDQGRDCTVKRPERLYLTVQNEGKSPLLVEDVELLAPSDLLLCEKGREAWPLPRSVGAGRHAVIPLPVGTGETLRPGTMPLVLEVKLLSNVDGVRREDRRLAADKVELRIPGLSEMLKVLGVPTLFLLPGMLVLGAFSLVAPHIGSKALAPNSLSFWIIAITGSLLLQPVFAGLSPTFGYTGDLTEGYNLAGVGWLWAISLGLGGIIGGLVRWDADIQRRAAEKQAQEELAGRTLRIGDDPMTVLRKLAKLDTAWPLSWHKVGELGGFLVEAPPGSRWLIPQARRSKRPDGLPTEDWTKARSALHDLQMSAPSLDGLMAGLEKEEIAPLLPLQWEVGRAPELLDEGAEAKKGNDHFFVAE